MTSNPNLEIVVSCHEETGLHVLIRDMHIQRQSIGLATFSKRGCISLSLAYVIANLSQIGNEESINICHGVNSIQAKSIPI
jgi:hypothetical protein